MALAAGSGSEPAHSPTTAETNRHQPALLFQHHVSGARQQTVTVAVENAGQGFHRTGQNHHAQRFKRAGRDTGSDIAHVMHHIGQRLYLA